jgi:hypothetical protein
MDCIGKLPIFSLELSLIDLLVKNVSFAYASKVDE